MIWSVEEGNGAWQYWQLDILVALMRKLRSERSEGSFQAAVLLPVNVCCANRRNVWHIQVLELRFTFEASHWRISIGRLSGQHSSSPPRSATKLSLLWISILIYLSIYLSNLFSSLVSSLKFKQLYWGRHLTRFTIFFSQASFLKINFSTTPRKVAKLATLWAPMPSHTSSCPDRKSKLNHFRVSPRRIWLSLLVLVLTKENMTKILD